MASATLVPFQPSRADGRSDRQVILDLVGDAEPETLFDHNTLIAELSAGLDSEVEIQRVYKAVAAANKTLLRERKRYLGVVKGLGYRVIRADEHLPVSIAKKETAEGYLRRAKDLLEHARLDELSEPHRSFHQGQLMLIASLMQSHSNAERRQDAIEKAIGRVEQRLEKLEGDD